MGGTSSLPHERHRMRSARWSRKPGPMVGAADADARSAHGSGEGQGTSIGGSRRRTTSSCARSSCRSTCPASASSVSASPTRISATTRRPGGGGTPSRTGTSLRAVVTGHGPASQARLDFRRVSFADTQWVREADPPEVESRLRHQPVAGHNHPRSSSQPGYGVPPPPGGRVVAEVAVGDAEPELRRCKARRSTELLAQLLVALSP